MMMTISCPSCQVDGSISLLEANYDGPYKCWKCRGLFKITIRDNKVASCRKLSEEEFEQEQEIYKLKNKFRKSD